MEAQNRLIRGRSAGLQLVADGWFGALSVNLSVLWVNFKAQYNTLRQIVDEYDNTEQLTQPRCPVHIIMWIFSWKNSSWTDLTATRKKLLMDEMWVKQLLYVSDAVIAL